MKATLSLALLPLLFVVFVGCHGPSRKSEYAHTKTADQKTHGDSLAPAAVPSAEIPEVPMPTIVSRSEWKAKAPISEMKRHEVKFITIHHTATKQNPKK